MKSLKQINCIVQAYLALPFLLIGILAMSEAKAQDTIKHIKGERWKLSINGGVLFSNYGTSNNLFAKNTLTKPFGGFSIVRNLNHQYALALQSSYTIIGQRTKDTSTGFFGGAYESQTLLPYIQTDLLFTSKWKFRNWQSDKVTLGIGLFMGYLLHPKTKARRLDVCPCEWVNGEVYGAKSFIGGVIGQIDFDTRKLFRFPLLVSLKYNHGVSNMWTGKYTILTSPPAPTPVPMFPTSMLISFKYLQ